MFDTRSLTVPRFRMLGGAFAAAVLVAAMQGPAAAAECKGMSKAQCEGNSACVWVDSYTRKDDVKVSGYCRSKGKKSSSSTSSTSSSN